VKLSIGKQKKAQTHARIIELLGKLKVEITQERSDAINRALCGNGRNAGRLLVRCPPSFGKKADPWAVAAWNGLQPNGYKVQFGASMMLNPEQKKFLVELSNFRWPSSLDADMHSLKQLGVW